MLKKLKENTAFKIARIIFKVLFVIFILIFVLTIYMQRFSGNKLSFFNFRMFTVISGSMEPDYKIGDVLLAKEVDPSTIKVGDDISYLGAAGDVRGKVVTHRVNSITKNSEGKLMFKTQGISNLIEDPVVSEDQIYGKIVYKPVVLSAFYKIIGTDVGFFLCIVIPVMGIIIYEMIVILLNKEEKRRKLDSN